MSDKMAQDDKTAYLGCAQLVQPLINAPKHYWEVHRPRRRHGHMKIGPTNVNQTQMNGSTYLGRINAIQSTWRPKKGIKRFNKLTFKCRKLGEPWHDVEDHG